MNQIRILDGGFGTQISKRLSKSIDSDPLWSSRLLVTHKQEVIDTHVDFLQAGSNVITTNTYQASINGFIEHLNLDKQQSYDHIKEAVKLAQMAVNVYKTSNPKGISINTDILIAGSVGPYGASLHDGSEYTGSYRDSISSLTLKEWHKPRISALIEGGVDLLAFETMPCKKEADVLLSILQEYPNTKAWLSFNCKDSKSIASGEDFQFTVRECYKLNPNQLVAVGANCISPLYVEDLFSNINQYNKEFIIPLIVYPNSGELYKTEMGWYGSEQCKPVYTYVEKWLNMGITWIGGCCRMYSDDIRKIQEAVKSWETRY